MFQDMLAMSSGGGGTKLIEGTQTISTGTNTITVNDVTEIQAVMYIANWSGYGSGSGGWAYIDNNNDLQRLSPNNTVIEIASINGNIITVSKSADYQLTAPLQYTVIGK